ncbi:MAG: SUMF1/EgtB/PvdO family nonheme iron enzyme [Pirellulales bacterium]|nr:SUMF1/EgtB/PvdO family nonheme iron enzyme [Pirellulales bacterium]
MLLLNHCVILATTMLLSLTNLGLGWWTYNTFLASGGAIGLCYVLARVVRRRRGARRQATGIQVPAAPRPRLKSAAGPVDPSDTAGLVEQMLAQGRFALLLRPQIADNLSDVHYRHTLETLQEAMALVPDGEVVVGRIDQALDDGKLNDDEINSAQGRVVRVQRFFLDRYPVTNRQFYEFVAAGGYQQVSLWDRSIWPAVLDMVDRTGLPGPRFWQDGCFLSGEDDHPVVGVSWYEASAYARWIGTRLPSDAEWAKAGSWPVPLSATSRIQRKYPWGENMDRTRCNLWGSGPNRVVSVHEFAEGVSVGGVYQLTGNVWEWTSANFRAGDHPSGDLVLPTPMKSIRGGAFDTYFDNQATCQFQSGESPLGRRHNIGFRCAVGVGDLALARSAAAGVGPEAGAPPAPQADETEAPLAEEVHA